MSGLRAAGSGVREQEMVSAFWVSVGTSVLLAWCWWKWRKMNARKRDLENRIEDLLTISDSLNRTQGRRARKITMRHATIGKIIRDIPALEPEHSQGP
jgi:hypothetical protein